MLSAGRSCLRVMPSVSMFLAPIVYVYTRIQTHIYLYICIYIYICTIDFGTELPDNHRSVRNALLEEPGRKLEDHHPTTLKIRHATLDDTYP